MNNDIIKLRLVGDEDKVKQIVALFDKADFESFHRPKKGNNPKYAGDDSVLCYMEIKADRLINILGGVWK